MSLFGVQRHSEQPTKPYMGRGWFRLRAAILRWFDRERELIRLRVAMGMMSEARQHDAHEYREMEQANRRLNERVEQLEHEQKAWRAAGTGARSSTSANT